MAEDIKDEVTQQKIYPNSIVTEITKLGQFYPAEGYHQDYYALNGNKNPYC